MAILHLKNNCILLSIIISDYEKHKLFKQGRLKNLMDPVHNMQEQFLAVWANVWYGSDNLKMIHKGNWDYFYYVHNHVYQVLCNHLCLAAMRIFIDLKFAAPNFYQFIYGFATIKGNLDPPR